MEPLYWIRCKFINCQADINQWLVLSYWPSVICHHWLAISDWPSVIGPHWLALSDLPSVIGHQWLAFIDWSSLMGAWWCLTLIQSLLLSSHLLSTYPAESRLCERFIKVIACKLKCALFHPDTLMVSKIATIFFFQSQSQWHADNEWNIRLTFSAWVETRYIPHSIEKPI